MCVCVYVHIIGFKRVGIKYRECRRRHIHLDVCYMLYNALV